MTTVTEQYLEIKTIPDLRRAIRSAKRIFVGANFGLACVNVRIDKKSAVMLCDEFTDDATPAEAEMNSGYFASVTPDGRDLYLG